MPEREKGDRTRTPRRASSQLVVVGSSAGGVDALSEFTSTLPSDLPVPVIIAQHLDPKSPSHLQEILARRTSLPVRTVADHDRLEPGVIFVVSSNQQVVVDEEEIRVQSDGATRPTPSIDLLLESAARSFGEGLIAVILTGTGSDGAVGARAVNAAGGTVVIQNPATAAFPGMPSSLAPAIVDVVAELSDIGPLVRQLVDGELPTTADEGELGSFLGRLREQSGIDFGSYRRGTIERRLRGRMAATGASSLGDYERLMSDDTAEYERLVSSFLIKVTEFFRDPALFDHLRKEVLPELIASTASDSGPLRIWSAGCATGEEAYSVAMLVADALGADWMHRGARIFGTDLDADAIAHARRGVYSAASLNGVPSAYRERFFGRNGAAFEVTKGIRDLTVFGQHDLGQRAPFPGIDLVLCRNVLMYFTPELQERALRVFAFALRDGGRLVLGKAESAAPLADVFAVDDAKLRVFRRHGSRSVMPPTPFGGHALALARPARASRPASSELDGAVSRARREVDRVRTGGEQADRVLAELRTGVVIVRPRYEILRINTAARRDLTIHGTAVGEDLVHQAGGLDAARLRAQLDGAYAGRVSTEVYAAMTTDSADGTPRHLEIRCEPHGASGSRADQVLVQIADVSERVAGAAEADSLGARLDRLATANRQLLDANEELSDANSLLRGTNEELLLSHEEVQAAAEEVETLNEELQASNEELETLNEELQASLEELHTSNTDLEMRSNELGASADSLSEERRRLAATLLAMTDAVVMVNERGDKLVSNAAYQRLFGELDGTLQGEEGGESIVLTEDDLVGRASRGEHYQLNLIVTAPGGDRRWYRVTGEPLTDGELVLGGVAVIHDLTDLSLRLLQEEFVSLVSHELKTPLTSLSGYLQLQQRVIATEPASADERVTRYGQRALRQARRLTQLIGDLFDASRLHRHQLEYSIEALDLSELVADTVEIAQPLADGAKVELASFAKAITVEGDAGRMQQVLLNLLMNAVRHSDADRIEVSLRRRKDEAELRVRDDGRGIPPDVLPHLFSRYYQGPSAPGHSDGGLGLGLYIAREIVTAHHGTISVRSRTGQGATFTVRLPLQG